MKKRNNKDNSTRKRTKSKRRKVENTQQDRELERMLTAGLKTKVSYLYPKANMLENVTPGGDIPYKHVWTDNGIILFRKDIKSFMFWMLQDWYEKKGIKLPEGWDKDE